MTLRPLNAEELVQMAAVRDAYRKMWSMLLNVPPCTFDGRREDIHTLNFIDYEAGDHPLGDAGAAIIWANVLVRCGGLRWAVNNAGQLVVVDDIESPNAAVCPIGRITEVNCGSPPHGKYTWALEEAVLHVCSSAIADDVRETMRALLEDPMNEGFLFESKATFYDLATQFDRRIVPT